MGSEDGEIRYEKQIKEVFKKCFSHPGRRK